MEKAKFNKISDATEEDCRIVLRSEAKYIDKLPNRILTEMKSMESVGMYDSYQVSVYEHSLQAATRAMRDNADKELIVATLLHDIGYNIATTNHGELAASILRPFVREEVTWIIEHHDIFSLYYYADNVPKIKQFKNMRDKFKENKWFNNAINFCEKYDGISFDPNYNSLPLSKFEPLIYDIFRKSDTPII